MGSLGEAVLRLVETDMPVVSQPQKLQVNAAETVDHVVIAGALRLGVHIDAARDMGIVPVDVDVIEEVVAHEIDVALGAVDVQPHILIQIHAPDLAEIQVALLIPRDELLIGTDGTAPGGQPQHAVGLQDDLRGDDVGSLPAHQGIVFCGNDFHCGASSLSPPEIRLPSM